MAGNFGIAKITDTQSPENHILLSCNLRSLSSVNNPAIGPAGTLIGSGHSFSGDGFTPGSGCILFDNIDPNQVLQHEGQIVIRAKTIDISAADNDASMVNMSNGHERASIEALWTCFNTANTLQGYLQVNTNSSVSCIPGAGNSTDGGSLYFSSVGLSTYCEICVW